MTEPKLSTHEVHGLVADALELVAELWPKPGYATVTLESHQWDRLRRLLLGVPELGENYLEQRYLTGVRLLGGDPVRIPGPEVRVSPHPVEDLQAAEA